MNAVSIWQPNASLIAEGIQQVETRKWQPSSYLVGQYIAIHAAKKYNDKVRADVVNLWVPLDRHGSQLAYGAIVGLVRLKRVFPSESEYALAQPEVVASERYVGGYPKGRFIWVFDEAKKCKRPVVCRGYMGVFRLEQWEEARVWTETDIAF